MNFSFSTLYHSHSNAVSNILSSHNYFKYLTLVDFYALKHFFFTGDDDSNGAGSLRMSQPNDDSIS